MKKILSECRNIKKSIVYALVLYSSIVPAFNNMDWNSYYWDGYSRESSLGETYSSWLSNIRDDVKLIDLSLPGTHDSAADNGGLSVQTQTMGIAAQLAAGVRFFDLRVRHIDGGFQMHHSIFFLHKSLPDVLHDIYAFFDAHPNEFVVIRLKKETADSNNSRTFKQDLKTLIDQHPDRWFVPSLIITGNWAGTSVTHKSLDALTVGELRGKIIMLDDGLPDNYTNDPVVAHYSWQQVDKQDDYNIVSVWGLYDKWLAVKNQVNRTNDQRDSWKLFANFLSANGGATPDFVASGRSSPNGPQLTTGLLSYNGNGSYPNFVRGACAGYLCSIYFTGTNVLTATYIAQELPSRVGIVVADFPGVGLIREIIYTNYRDGRRVANSYTGNNRRLATGTGQLRMTNGSTSVCVQRTSDNPNLFFGACSDDSHAQWQIAVPSPYAVSTILWKGSADQCLDVPNHQYDWGTQLTTYACNGGTNQMWVLIPDPADSTTHFTIRPALHRKLCLDAKGASFSEGTIVELWECNGQANQRFFMP